MEAHSECTSRSQRVAALDASLLMQMPHNFCRRFARVAGKFPLRAGFDARVLELANPNADYCVIRGAVQGLLQAGHISDPITSTYSRLLVDEYQDCNTAQHGIVCSIAQTLPTCILGVPMQAIFGFRDPLVHWEREAQAAFPPIGALQTPWRWRLAGMDALGAWLLQVRASLQAGQPMDLRGAPEGVQWVQLTQGTELQQRLVPLSDNPVERNWYVMHTSDKRLPQVAGLFRDCLVERGASAASARRSLALTEARRGRRAFAPVGCS